METVQVLLHPNKKNLDGKVYTQDLVNLLIEKLKTYKHVFSSFEPGPKAMKEIIGDVLDVKQEDNKIVAQIKISKEWESKIKPIINNCGIYFRAIMQPHYTDNLEIIDKDDIKEDLIFFSMVQKQ